jgi:hypothetical protein
MPWLREHRDGVTIDLHVQPRASKNEIVGLQGEELKVRLTSPPVEGEANRLCVEFFAKMLKVPKSTVELVAGEKSRHKRLLIRGVGAEDVRRTLE